MDSTQVIDGIAQMSGGYQLLFQLLAGAVIQPIGVWLGKKLPGDFTIQPDSYMILLNLGLAYGLALITKEPYTIYGLLAIASMGYATGKVIGKGVADVKPAILKEGG